MPTYMLWQRKCFTRLNNNNNNQQQCLWCCPHDHGHCESSPGSFDECRLSAGWPPTLRPSQPTWVVSPPISGCYHPHPPSPFVIITQPESWYSFYRPTEGGRLSRRRHCRKGAQPVPNAVHRSGCRDKHNWPRASHTAVNHAIAKPLWPAEARGCKQLALRLLLDSAEAVNWTRNLRVANPTP